MIPFSLPEAIGILERTPAVLRALLAGLPERWVHANEGEATWSPHNVLGHLIDGEETDWIPRMRLALRPDGPHRFQPVDRVRHLEWSGGWSVESLLSRFEELRAESIAELRACALTEADLAREAEHPALGRVTLRQLLATWTTHDLAHLVQVSRTLAKQYRAEVGPWAAYLSVLQDGKG